VSRANCFPYLKVGLILAVVVVGVARMRGIDIPSRGQEFTRCLAACRAIVSRRLAEEDRDKHMTRSGQRHNVGNRAA
jgi:hypothetical protein